MISGQPRPIRTETEDQSPPLRLKPKPPDAPRGHIDAAGGRVSRTDRRARLSSRLGQPRLVPPRHLGRGRTEGPHRGADGAVRGLPLDGPAHGRGDRRGLQASQPAGVPPDVVGEMARAALLAASGHDSTASVADILAGNGVTTADPPGAPVVVPHPDRPNPRRRSAGKATAAIPVDDDQRYRASPDVAAQLVLLSANTLAEVRMTRCPLDLTHG